MGHKLLVFDNNNYQNTELRECIAFHVMVEWLLVRYAWLCPLIVLCCILLISITLIGHNIDDCV